MATQVIPTSALQAALKATRRDLDKVRSVNTTLSQKVTALSNRTQFNDAYIRTETTKLREQAKEEAASYLTGQATFSRLKNIAGQEQLWTVPMFLSRGMVVPDGVPRVNVKKTSLSDTPLFCKSFSCPWSFSTQGHWSKLCFLTGRVKTFWQFFRGVSNPELSGFFLALIA